MDITINWDSPIDITIKEGAKTTIDLLESEGNLQWSGCYRLTSLVDEKQSIEIWAGESDWGSDGFVSVMDLSSKNLIWIAFFNDSNPFNKLAVIDEEIQATSTLGCIWKFKIENPVDIVVQCS